MSHAHQKASGVIVAETTSRVARGEKMNAEIRIRYSTDSERAHQSLLALLNNVSPYMVDNVEIEITRED